MCKYNELCSSGWIFDEQDEFKGRCECSVKKYEDAYFQWSEIKKTKLKRELNEVNDFPIYFNAERTEETKTMFKQEISELVSIKESLLKGSVIGLKGKAGQGKTQFAITLALEMFKSIDWNKNDDELEILPYMFINLGDMVINNTLFDNERKTALLKKIAVSKILIIDEFGDELMKSDSDKRLPMIYDLLKYILDNFEGVLIYTTNHLKIEELYRDKSKRVDITSRLFGNGDRENYLTYGFTQAEDLRDKEEDEKLKRFKSRFTK